MSGKGVVVIPLEIAEENLPFLLDGQKLDPDHSPVSIRLQKEANGNYSLIVDKGHKNRQPREPVNRADPQEPTP